MNYFVQISKISLFIGLDIKGSTVHINHKYMYTTQSVWFNTLYFSSFIFIQITVCNHVNCP